MDLLEEFGEKKPWTRVSLGRRCLARKALPGFFLCIFSSLTCAKKPGFSKGDLLQWKVPSKLYWNLLTSGRYQPACLSLFLKSGKIPAVLYIGKGREYRPFRDLRSVPEALLLYINFDSFHHLNQVGGNQRHVLQ